jgi:hypothetical protein
MSYVVSLFNPRGMNDNFVEKHLNQYLILTLSVIKGSLFRMVWYHGKADFRNINHSQDQIRCVRKEQQAISCMEMSMIQ